MSPPLRIVQCGLGPIGLGVTREIATRKGVVVVGAVDVDPRLVGEDLGALAGLPHLLGVSVEDDAAAVLRHTDADVAVVATTSRVTVLRSHVQPFLERGLHVVSSCEELAYPFRAHPKCAKEIDALARANGVAVLGTGVNPGFLMDFWPLVATSILRRVDAVRIDRIQDASRRRLPFQRKIGAGLTVQEFEAKVAEGTLRHAGLTESMHLIADGLGWELDSTQDVVLPVLADTPISTENLEIQAGMAAGIEQVGRGYLNGREVLTLRFRAVVGEGENRDEVRIEGEPPLRVSIPGGVNGDAATCSILANAAQAIVRARPGLRHMADGPLLACRAR